MPKLPPNISDWPEYHRVRFEERAAFHEFEGGLSRQDAEAMAEKAIRKAHFMVGMAELHNSLTRDVVRPGRTYASVTEGK